ncbi:MAG: hypothetical protein KJZ70_11660 [Bryobacterales bacterium]|nr:hypothetical protein [Bryobacterales bacterium]
MEVTVRICFALVLLAAHSPFAVAFLRSIRRRQIPEVLSFAAIGILLRYDLGFVLESFGWTFVSPFFAPIASYSLENFVTTGLVILAAPYLLAIGFHAMAGRAGIIPDTPCLQFAPRMKLLFFLLFLPVSLALGIVGFIAIDGAASAAEAKRIWLGTLGGGYIIFLVPMFVLAFYLRTHDCRSKSGNLILIFLLLSSVSATLFLGQRTMTLLPVLILVLFRFRLGVARLGFAVALLLVFAGAALDFYKGHAVRQDLDLDERMEMVVGSDLVRANVLARAIDESETIGVKLLPMTGQGYLYTALFYIPRSWVPQKGYSTAAYFTAFANGEDTEFIAWGLGLGFLEEIILNFGFLAIVPGVIFYGMGLGLLQRVCRAFDSTVVGVSLAAIWMSGYVLPSVVLYFGSMTVFAILLESCFIRRLGTALAQVESGVTAEPGSVHAAMPLAIAGSHSHGD